MIILGKVYKGLLLCFTCRPYLVFTGEWFWIGHGGKLTVSSITGFGEWSAFCSLVFRVAFSV